MTWFDHRWRRDPREASPADLTGSASDCLVACGKGRDPQALVDGGPIEDAHAHPCGPIEDAQLGSFLYPSFTRSLLYPPLSSSIPPLSSLSTS